MAAAVQEILAQNDYKKDRLLEILRELQAQKTEHNSLTEADLVQVAEGLDVPLAHIYGVATFYSLYSISPRGQHVIRMCENAPCHIQGAKQVIAEFERQLGISVNETTPDKRFTLELTSCLGVCGVAPAVMIDSAVYGNLTPEKVADVLAQYKEG